jgi:zinc transporter 1/2/3
LLSIFSIFILELIAFRWGTAKLRALGLSHDPHGHAHGSHAAHGPEGEQTTSATHSGTPTDDIEKHLDQPLSAPPQDGSGFEDSLLTRIIGIAILEFGVVLHSVLIGLTLAVTDGFIVLFIVIIFHQTFEGLGVGSRLAYLDLPKKYNYVAIVGALLYGITTPIGIAAGLGVRTTYNPDSVTSNIVSGTLDCLSSGILIYTGLVELLAHEFLFNNKMQNASNGKLAYALICMLFGCGIMALLGKWA